MRNVTCKKCGWVHFSMSRAEAQENVDSFNRYFDSLPYETQKANYGGITFVDDKPVYGEPRKSSIESYERCFNCRGPYTNFRPSVDGDCPNGCTIQPIIHFEET